MGLKIENFADDDSQSVNDANCQCSLNSSSTALSSAGLIKRACATVTECNGPSSFLIQKLRNLFSSGNFGKRSKFCQTYDCRSHGWSGRRYIILAVVRP
jgi:hypothetical protein